MSVQTRIIPQDEADAGFSLLKNILEIVKNPQAVEEAYEIRRKAVALTDEEIAKGIAGRALIAQADSLRDELQKKEDALSAEKLKHEDNVAASKADFDKKSKDLQDWADKLSERENGHREIEDRHKEAKAKLETDASAMRAAYAEQMGEIAAKKSAAEQAVAAAAQQKQKLAEWESKLKEKAAKLAAITSDW